MAAWSDATLIDHIRDYIPAQQVETPSHELNPVEDVPRRLETSVVSAL